MKNKMLIMIGFSSFLGWGLNAYADPARGVLLTPSFVVVIAEQCPEGDVSCDRVTYTGVNRKTGAALTLQGKAMTTLCKDDATPCRHLGWLFKKGDTSYMVSDEGTLNVTKGDKTVIEQRGTWAK